MKKNDDIANGKTQSTTTKREWTWPWETAQGLFWTVSYLAMVAFAYFTPLDVLDTYPQAKEFSDFMASWNMQIRRVGEISGPANQANRFVYSVLWCVMPIYWCLAAVSIHQANNGFNLKAKSWFSFVISSIAGLILIFFSLALRVDATSMIGHFLFTFRFGRSIYSAGLIWLVGFIAIVLIFRAWTILTKRVVITGGKHG